MRSLPNDFSLLSVVLPCFHLGASMEKNLLRVAEILREENIPFELVPVDDGSCDGTEAAFGKARDALGADTVRPVVFPENRGKGAALQVGFEHSRGSHILLLDGDLDLNPSYTGRFLDIMTEKKADIVIGSKLHPESKIQYPLKRRIASFVYYSIVKILVGLPVHDTQTGMKLFRREALGYSFSRMLSKRFAFDLEVLAIAHGHGYRIAEAPIELDFGTKAGALTVRNVREVMTDTLGIFYRLRLLRYYASLEPHAMPDVPPSVSVVIACPKNSHLLEEAVEALGKQIPAPQEVLVLPDEPSGRDWPAFVREIPTGKVLPSDKRNIGIREAKGEIVAFLDDDARPLEGWLAHALPYFSDPEIGAVGGPAVTPPEDPFLAKLSGRVYENALVSGSYRRRYRPTRVCDEDDLPSCNLLVRRTLLQKIGGFNTAYWPGEDTILCLDITHRQKARMIYDPWVGVFHHRRPLFLAHARQVGRYASHRGFFCKKFPETSRRLSYMLPSLLLLGTLAEALLFLVCCGCMAFAPEATATSVFWTLFQIGRWVLIVYLSLAALSSVPFPSVHHPIRWLRSWILTATGVVLTHFTYGWYFLVGLFAKELPGHVAAFDHQGSTSRKDPC